MRDEMLDPGMLGRDPIRDADPGSPSRYKNVNFSSCPQAAGTGYSGSDQEKCSEKYWDQIPCYCCLPSIEPEGSISSAITCFNQHCAHLLQTYKAH